MARKERSAGFVIFRQAANQREFLLLDYGRHWDLPKGHVEKGENDLATATRELREETGITDPHVVPQFRQEIGYFFRDRRKGLIHKVVIFFLAETTAGPADIVLSHEHEGFEFLPFDAAIKRITFPTAREVLKRAEERLQAADDNVSPQPIQN